jgi:AraC-like DNA-binding protein
VLSQTCCDADPALWLWPGHAIYAGPALDLDMHSGSVACLAIGLDAAFIVQLGTRPERTARSALIAPRLKHRLVAQEGRMMFCYLDPGSSLRHACEQQMTSGDQGLLLGHRAERELITIRPCPSRRLSGQYWLELAAPGASFQVDFRIQHAVERLREELNLSAAELASDCGLSTSRFLHLFPAHTGTSFRRYRLWARMLRVAHLISAGRNLTTASADAGFASPSHFSEAFYRMFGLQPSRLLAAGVTIIDVSAAAPDSGHWSRPVAPSAATLEEQS